MDPALQLVDVLADDWDPAEYRDTYREALRAAVERKVEGKDIEAPAISAPPKVPILSRRFALALRGRMN